MSLERVLIVDDEPLVQNSLGEFLRRRRYQVSHAGTLAEATAHLQREAFDLVFLDVRLPDGDGHQFLEAVLGSGHQTIAVMITGHGSIESAVNCMRIGAFDYILKPFSLSQIDVLLQKAESFNQLINVNRYLNDPEAADSEIIGQSSAVQRLRQLVARVAPTDATVLITGENGTGKELVARDLFRRSTRRDHPYIAVNCAALSETLIESELFGHERGAFTGASDRRTGRFELANRGTLLLDEISEIPMSLQAKLLRVLQERELERVGGTKTIKINVRVIATSNRNLLDYVKQGNFREDLYYRLNVFPLEVPALREREEDATMLAEAFLQRFARKHRRQLNGFTPEALRQLSHYPWPGNVRELQNTVERAVILAEEGRPISSSLLMLPQLSNSGVSLFRSEEALSDELPCPIIDDLPAESDPGPPSEVETAPAPRVAPPIPAPAPPGPSKPAIPSIRPLEEMEREAILEALRATEGNRTRAADLLGVTSRTLRNKLAHYRKSDSLPPEFENGEAP